MLGSGFCDAAAEEVMVSHFDGVGEAFEFCFVDVVDSDKVVGANAVDYCSIW